MECTAKNEYGGAKRGCCDETEREIKKRRVDEVLLEKWTEGEVRGIKESKEREDMSFWVERMKLIFLAVLEKIYKKWEEFKQTLRGILTQKEGRRQEQNSGHGKAKVGMGENWGRVKEMGREEKEFDILWRNMNREIDEKLMRLRIRQKTATKMEK